MFWSDFDRIQSKSFKNEGHIYVQSSLSLNCHEEDNNTLTTITHVINASSSIKDYDPIYNMERDTIFSHVVLDMGIFYCNMITTSGSDVINPKLQIEGQNEVISFKVIPNFHFVPSQFTHVINASSSTSSHVIKDYDAVCNMERDTKFSHVVLDISLFYCNMITTSGSNVINSKLQTEGHNEVIDFKVIPNCHFVPSQLINDDVVLKNSFFTESLSQFFNHITDKIHFSYDPHEISVFSMNAL